MRISNNTHNIA